MRDLGSSNGTFVNGKRVTRPAGPEGRRRADRRRGDPARRHARPAGGRAARVRRPASPGDTAVVEAVAVGDEDEFEIEFDEGEPAADIDAIPLADADEAPRRRRLPRTAPAAPAAEKAAAKPAASKGEDEAVAQFLLDLNLDEE